LKIRSTWEKKEVDDMSAAASINFWGVLAALSFAGMMGMILWRMLQVSRTLRIAVARIPGSPQRILVPISDAPSSQRGIDLARRLRETPEAEIRLLHVIEVPMTLPLDARLPHAETKAKEILRQAESWANCREIQIGSEIKRGRLASEEIVRAAEDWEADMIVMTAQPGTRLWQKIFGRTSERVRRQATCEVLLDDFVSGRFIKREDPVAKKMFLNSDLYSQWSLV